MSYIKNITRYFKQSLIDSERMCPDDKSLKQALGLGKSKSPSSNHIAVDQRVWLTGRIDADLAARIIESKQPKAMPPLQEAELVLFPRIDLFRNQRGWDTNYKRQVLVPIVLFVRLQKDGALRPTAKAPWIPRQWLAPHHGATPTFGESSAVDAFFTQNPFEGIASWPQVVAYCTALLCAATGNRYIQPQSETGKAETTIFDFEILAQYAVCRQCLLQINPPIVGIKKQLIKVLDILLDQQQMPLLYHNFCSNRSPKLKANRNLQYSSAIAKAHLGQMSGEFPLSPMQRNALHQFIIQKKGDILAVNGPPGTGKTTLLRSVVSNLWTQAALNELEPPLIVATSNNNQAVTNILESFAKVDEDGIDESLKGRWLPEVNSYGLYCCAYSKANDRTPYLYHGPKGEGGMAALQTQAYLDRATDYFITKTNAWLSEPIRNVTQAKVKLHQALQRTQRQINAGIDALTDMLNHGQKIKSKYGGIKDLLDEIALSEQHLKNSESEYSSEKSLLDEVYRLWERRSTWVRLLIWLPAIRKREHLKTARLLNRLDIHLDDNSDKAVKNWFKARIGQSKKEIEATHLRLSDMQQDRNAYEHSKAFMYDWIKHHQPSSLFSQTHADLVSEINDRVLRFKMFKLATHYWEARWLSELQEFFANHDSDKKSPARVLRKLRRFAKLTPCFVSTFYMLAPTFMAGAYKDNTWMDIPLFDEVDLLIVDEAGQALPEVSAPSFAFAKRALIVGDTDQIEPVWSIPQSIDRANLSLFGLLANERQYHFWLQSGLLASDGNVMRVAQRQCTYHQLKELQRGLYLTEHRRCYNSIISYCNSLVYKGVLEPLRGEPQTEVPWGTMSMISVSTTSKPYGSSRANPGEAEQIANWIATERTKIIEYARRANPKWINNKDEEIMKLSIGIITPFSKQASLIKENLKKKNIEALTVGTIHSLQGAERLIILFSSVYGENDRDASKFYDIAPNMLNVAVSRAKDTFIVFGNLDVFGATCAGTPSDILRAKLVNYPALKRQA